MPIQWDLYGNLSILLLALLSSDLFPIKIQSINYSSKIIFRFIIFECSFSDFFANHRNGCTISTVRVNGDCEGNGLYLPEKLTIHWRLLWLTFGWDFGRDKMVMLIQEISKKAKDFLHRLRFSNLGIISFLIAKGFILFPWVLAAPPVPPFPIKTYLWEVSVPDFKANFEMIIGIHAINSITNMNTFSGPQLRFSAI